MRYDPSNLGYTSTQPIECLEVPTLLWFSYSVDSKTFQYYMIILSRMRLRANVFPASILVQKGNINSRRSSFTPYGFKISDPYLAPFSFYTENNETNLFRLHANNNLSGLIINEDVQDEEHTTITKLASSRSWFKTKSANGIGIEFDLQLCYKRVQESKTQNPLSIFYQSNCRNHDKDRVLLYPDDGLFPELLQ